MQPLTFLSAIFAHHGALDPTLRTTPAMRILMLAAASSVHAVRWANAYVERGHEVHLVTQHDPDAAISVEVEVYRLPHRRGLGYVWNGNKLKQLVRYIQPDVINVHYATGYGTLSLAVEGIPIVLNVWGSDVFEFPDKSRLHHKWLQRNLMHADRVVSTSVAMARRTRQVGGKHLQITVVPFGVGTELFHPAIGNERHGDQCVIGTVKTLAHVYGIDLLIRAFAITVGELPEFPLRLMLIGSGPEKEDLERLVMELNISDQVEFIGAIPHADVAEALRNMDIFCALSRRESFGVAVLEASASGLPVIVSNVGGLPEVVKDNITGIIVPPEDPQAAADAMIALLRSPERKEELGAAGRSFVEKEYGWEASVDRMLAVLDQAVQRGRR